MQAPPAYEPLLKTFFTVSYVALAAFVGAFADSMPKWRVMFISNTIKIIGCAMMFFAVNPLLAYAVVGLGAAAFVVFLGGDARVAAALAVGAAAVSYFTLPWGITYYTASSAFWAIMNPMVAMMAIIDPPVIIEYVYPRSYEVTGAITMGLSHAWLVTAGWLVLLGTLGYLRFTRRDIKD